MLRFLIIFLSLPALAEQNSNLTSVSIKPSSIQNIGTYYTQNIPGYPLDPINNLSTLGASTVSLAINSITGPNYHGLMVINQTNTPISVTTTTAMAAPAANSNRNLYIISQGIGTWDWLPIFNYVYVESQGSSINLDNSGTIQIMVWGGND